MSKSVRRQLGHILKHVCTCLLLVACDSGDSGDGILDPPSFKFVLDGQAVDWGHGAAAIWMGVLELSGSEWVISSPGAPVTGGGAWLEIRIANYRGVGTYTLGDGQADGVARYQIGEFLSPIYGTIRGGNGHVVVTELRCRGGGGPTASTETCQLHGRFAAIMSDAEGRTVTVTEGTFAVPFRK